MRGNAKSAMTGTQPSLFHLWNTKGRLGKDQMEFKEEDIPKDVPVINTHSPEREGSYSVANRVTDVLSDSSWMQDCEVQCIEVLDTSESPPLIANGVEKGPQRESNGESMSRPQSSDLKMTVTDGKNEQGPTNGNTRTRLFPIFGKRDQHHAVTPSPESEKAGEKEAHGAGTKKTGKTATRSKRSKAPKSTANERVNLGLSCDDTLIRPSSQPLYSQEIMNYIPDDNIPGPSAPSMARGSQEEPIVIESSPVRDATGRKTLVHPTSPTKPHRLVRGEVATGFFAPRKRYTSSTASKRRTKVGEGKHVKWPDKDSQHVHGSQTSFVGPSIVSLGFRSRPRKEDPSGSLSTSISHLRIEEASHRKYEPKYLVKSIDTQAERHAKCESVIRSSTPCPAISRFLTASHDATASSWTEKWRPRCANEVMGNNESTLYLRDWLVALEIRTDVQVTSGDAEVAAGSHNKASQGTKRPQIIRSVDKPRKRKKRADSDEESLGDWLTSDEEEDTAIAFVDESEEDDKTEFGRPWKPKLTRVSRRRPPDTECLSDQANVSPVSVPKRAHDFSGRLANAILLTGPTGSGKTGSVYACAEELGWEVFEVYPGIGKRNGTSLLSLVGDVGRNHIVNRTSRGAPNTHEKHLPASGTFGHLDGGNKTVSQETMSQAFTSFFSQDHEASEGSGGDDLPKPEHPRVDRSAPGTSQSSSAAHVRNLSENCVTNNRSATPVESLGSRRIGARQSIILLEEVDILFGEDVNFWPTVVALIRESRRPVIMTCNDLSLVPSDILPLQTILTFNSCPPESAVPYLQCMALAEGYAVTETHVKSLYERRHYPDVLDNSTDLVRTLTCPSFPPDLRRAINSLQFLCQGSPGSDNIDPSPISIVMDQKPSTDFDLDELYSWNWYQNFTSDFLSVSHEQASGQRKPAHVVSRLWRISDSLSIINSCLARRPLANLELYSYSTGPPSDVELGHQCLEFDSDSAHLQDGIVQYNLDEDIATEATECARRLVRDDTIYFGSGMMGEVRTDERWKGTNLELLLESTGHFARVSGVLEKIVPVAIRQGVGGLILDYEPWVRMIDRNDMELEAAAVKESETRRGTRGGRSTRNSQRTDYQRYFDLEEEERNVWQGSGFA